MRSFPRIAALTGALLVILSLSCSEDRVLVPGPGSKPVDTLLENLELPKGLCVHGDSIYYTETAAHNSPYGGKVALSVYNIATRTTTELVNPMMYCDAIAFHSWADIHYAVGYINTIPGDTGAVSIIMSVGLESYFTSVQIAANDVTIDGDRNMYIIGPSDNPSAKSLYKFPANHYNTPAVLLTGLGRVFSVTTSADTIYFGGLPGIQKLAPGGSPEPFSDVVATSLSCYSPFYVFYANVATGDIGRIDIETGENKVLLSDCNLPTAVRYHHGKRKLYILEAGTEANQYRDGRLLVLNRPY